MKYYVRIADESRGPYTIEELRSLRIDADTYVWREGLAQWVRAAQEPPLAELLAASRALSTHPLNPYQASSSTRFGEVPGSFADAPLVNSGYGAASLLLGIGCYLFYGGMIAYVIAIQQRQGAPMAPNDTRSFGIGLSCCGGMALQLVGLGLGVAGLLQPQRKRLLAILGLCLNGAPLLLLAVLMLVGYLMTLA